MDHLGNYIKMNNIINDMVKSFESPSKTRKQRYNDFLVYIYMTFDKKISLCRTDKEINKYKKMRTIVLRYIVANERAITTKICK